jgi:hypothetical protein
MCSHGGMRLKDYPLIVVRLACRECPRIGRYRVAVLAERFGANADMEDVLEAMSASCGAPVKQQARLRCGVYFPDLPPDKPPDVPKALLPRKLPRKRLRIIRGGRG